MRPSRTCTGTAPCPRQFSCHHRWSITSPAQHTPMDALVPPDVTAELTQILSNLVLGDNEIRSKYATSSSPTQYLTTHLFQRRGSRRRAPGSQTRCLSSRPDSVCHKSRHRRSGRSAMSLTFSIFLHVFYRHPNNPRVLCIDAFILSRPPSTPPLPCFTRSQRHKTFIFFPVDPL